MGSGTRFSQAPLFPVCVFSRHSRHIWTRAAQAFTTQAVRTWRRTRANHEVVDMLDKSGVKEAEGLAEVKGCWDC